MSAQPATIAALAATHLESVQQLQDDFHRAQEEITDLRAEIARLTAQVQMQDSEIIRIRARGNYYEHFSVAVVTKLYDIGHLINSAIAEAREKGHLTDNRGADEVARQLALKLEATES